MPRSAVSTGTVLPGLARKSRVISINEFPSTVFDVNLRRVNEDVDDHLSVQINPSFGTIFILKTKRRSTNRVINSFLVVEGVRVGKLGLRQS